MGRAGSGLVNAGANQHGFSRCLGWTCGCGSSCVLNGCCSLGTLGTLVCGPATSAKEIIEIRANEYPIAWFVPKEMRKTPIKDYLIFFSIHFHIVLYDER
jgi:hypothetical protein